MRYLAARQIWLRAAALAVLACTLAACGTPRPTGSLAPSPAPTATAGITGDDFKVYFLSVGKGDAALLSLPGGKWAMVDTGPTGGFAAVNGMLRTLGVKKLEAVFISHPHNDHVGNLEGVLGIAACPTVYTTPADFGKPTLKLNETAAAGGAVVQALKPGERVETAGVTFTALGPNGTYSDENDNSLVLMAEYSGFKVLFTGDQMLNAESALLKTGQAVDCDILKVAHHGQDDASSDAFIRAAAPKYAIISTSNEGDDVPSGIVLERLNKAGIMALTTGVTGTVAVSPAHPEPQAVTPAEASAALAIARVDVETEYVEISNPTGGDVNLTGWGVLSDKGNQYYAFPDGTVLKPGASVRVYSGISKDEVPAGSLYWSDKKIWHDKKTDTASLMDPYGRTVATR